MRAHTQVDLTCGAVVCSDERGAGCAGESVVVPVASSASPRDLSRGVNARFCAHEEQVSNPGCSFACGLVLVADLPVAECVGHQVHGPGLILLKTCSAAAEGKARACSS
jgi:hypothetical protein